MENNAINPKTEQPVIYDQLLEKLFRYIQTFTSCKIYLLMVLLLIDDTIKDSMSVNNICCKIRWYIQNLIGLFQFVI